MNDQSSNNNIGVNPTNPAQDQMNQQSQSIPQQNGDIHQKGQIDQEHTKNQADYISKFMSQVTEEYDEQHKTVLDSDQNQENQENQVKKEPIPIQINEQNSKNDVEKPVELEVSVPAENSDSQEKKIEIINDPLVDQNLAVSEQASVEPNSSGYVDQSNLPMQQNTDTNNTIISQSVQPNNVVKPEQPNQQVQPTQQIQPTLQNNMDYMDQTMPAIQQMGNMNSSHDGQSIGMNQIPEINNPSSQKNQPPAQTNQSLPEQVQVESVPATQNPGMDKIASQNVDVKNDFFESYPIEFTSNVEYPVLPVQDTTFSIDFSDSNDANSQSTQKNQIDQNLDELSELRDGNNLGETLPLDEYNVPGRIEVQDTDVVEKQGTENLNYDQIQDKIEYEELNHFIDSDFSENYHKEKVVSAAPVVSQDQTLQNNPVQVNNVPMSNTVPVVVSEEEKESKDLFENQNFVDSYLQQQSKTNSSEFVQSVEPQVNTEIPANSAVSVNTPNVSPQIEPSQQSNIDFNQQPAEVTEQVTQQVTNDYEDGFAVAITPPVQFNIQQKQQQQQQQQQQQPVVQQDINEQQVPTNQQEQENLDQTISATTASYSSAAMLNQLLEEQENPAVRMDKQVNMASQIPQTKEIKPQASILNEVDYAEDEVFADNEFFIAKSQTSRYFLLLSIVILISVIGFMLVLLGLSFLD